MDTLASALALAVTTLVNSPTPRLDAEVLLAHTLGVTRSYLLAWPEQVLTTAQREAFNQFINERQRGVPIAYLLKCREFWSLTLEVSADTLIPRPETELLVEIILARFEAQAPLEVADLGTGSGAIALALASERPNWRLIGTDCNLSALKIAQNNQRRLGLANISFALGHWCKALPDQRFDLLVSNPPYIAADDEHLACGDLRFEPVQALVGGEDGLAALQVIMGEAPAYLKPGGWLFLEHGYDQGKRLRDGLRARGYGQVCTFQDYAGVDRVTIAQYLL